MIPIKATIDTREAEAFANELERIIAEGLDMIVDRVAFQTLRTLVEDTKDAIDVRPDGSRWNIEKPEDKWAVEKPADYQRRVFNPSSVMLWLDQGTANKGTGYIYPTNKKALFIPLKRTAAGGWSPELVRGEDYILAGRVQGITPRNIVSPVRREAQEALKREGEEFIKAAIAQARQTSAGTKG